MANLHKELKGLFNKYLERLAEEKRSNVSTYHYTPSNVHQGSFFNDDENVGIIYFYEWSDIHRAPRSFYTMKAFDNFLIGCQIYLKSYQKELIHHIFNPYIACKKDGSDIIIRASYDDLKKALESENKEPYNVGITRVPSTPSTPSTPPIPKGSVIHRPPMYCEAENRWPEMSEMNSDGFWEW